MRIMRWSSTFPVVCSFLVCIQKMQRKYLIHVGRSRTPKYYEKNANYFLCETKQRRTPPKTKLETLKKGLPEIPEN